MPPLSKSAEAIAPSGIRKFFDLVAATEGVISLGVGEPDFYTPWAIREASIYSIEKGRTTYTSNYGLLELRQLLAEHIWYRYNVEYNPGDEILVTVGVSEAMDLAMRAILDPGDEVIVPEPCYVSYKPCVELAGGVAKSIITTSEQGFLPTMAQLEAASSKRTKALILGYPANPTGAVMNRQRLAEIVQFADKHDIFLISDEIYDRLTYEGTHTCTASMPGAKKRTIMLNGFSKAYAMTGWRIGYACAPADVIGVMNKIHSYTIICAPIMAQRAAIEALKHGEESVRQMVEHYNRRRRLIVAGLTDIGLPCHMPQGAFYAFPSIESTGMSCEQFAENLLLEEKVAVVPGNAFGAGGDGHIRLSYATSIEKIEIAIRRMGSFMVAHQPSLAGAQHLSFATSQRS
jgi:aminotransferase